MKKNLLKKLELRNLSTSWYFLGIILTIYIFLSIFKPTIFSNSLEFFSSLLYKLIPIFFVVFILMSLSNYFITPKFVEKHLKRKGIKKWFFVVVGGILSSGPIYMWYPLLADLRNKGLSYGLIACFLYNRAIKIPLIPIAAIYFSWQYILILTLVMIFISIIQGLIINKIMEVKK